MSVVIVTWNSKQTIEDCLESLLKDEIDKEIIVVDNASSDATGNLIKKKFPQVILLKNRQNSGFAKANNYAIAKAMGELILLLNPDAKLLSGSLKQMASFISKDPKVAVVAPKLLSSDNKLQREMRPFPTVISEIMILLRLHRLPLLCDVVYPKFDYQKIQPAEHLMGSALLIRKSAFEKVGGFDENFFLWYEETDLLKRIKQAGFKIFYFPEATALHQVGHSTKKLDPIIRQTIWNKSLLYYFKKHSGWFTMSLLLPFVALSYLPALVLSLKLYVKSSSGS